MSVSNTSTMRKPIGVVRGLIGIVIAVAAFFAGGIVASTVIPQTFFAAGPATILGRFIFIIIILTIVLKFEGRSWRDLGLSLRGNFAGSVVIAAALTGVMLVIYKFGLPVLYAQGLPPLDVSGLASFIKGNLTAYITFMVFVVWGSAAIGEEMLYRGFLMNRLEGVFSWAPATIFWAVILQAVIFGLSHGYQGVTGIIATGVIGLLMGIAYYASGRNLLVPILTHGFADSIFITAAYFGKVDMIIPQ